MSINDDLIQIKNILSPTVSIPVVSLLDEQEITRKARENAIFVVYAGGDFSKKNESGPVFTQRWDATFLVLISSVFVNVHNKQAVDVYEVADVVKDALAGERIGDCCLELVGEGFEQISPNRIVFKIEFKLEKFFRKVKGG